jgi:hypothetical protein
MTFKGVPVACDPPPDVAAGPDADVGDDDGAAVVAVVLELLEWLLDPQAPARSATANSPTARRFIPGRTDRPDPSFMVFNPSWLVWLRSWSCK